MVFLLGEPLLILFCQLNVVREFEAQIKKVGVES